MRLIVTAVFVAGCAQIAGLDKTTGALPDSPPADAAPDGLAIDGPRACLGGDARVTDPTSGACYVLFTTPQRREDARVTCAGLAPNGQLAKIETASASSLIATLVGTNDALLGATDATVEGTFVWQDGTAVVLTNWNVGEPNNGLGMFEEDCVVMIGLLGGVWDDRPCAPTAARPLFGSYPFVCAY